MIERIFSQLQPAFRKLIAHPGISLSVAALVTAAGVLLASSLRIDTNLTRLLPADNETVKALNVLRETVGGESEVSVVIESPSFEANKAFAERFIPAALALTGERFKEPYLYRVEYRKDTSFIRKNALYFATDEELDRLETFLKDEIEDARLAANPFYFDLDEDDSDSDSDQSETDNFRDTFDRLVPKEYPVSDDSTTLVLRFYPTGAQTNIGFIDDLYGDLQNLTDSLTRADNHPDLTVSLAGRLLRQLTEVRAITNDVRGSVGGGVATVMLIVMLYFSFKVLRSTRGTGMGWRARARLLARMPLVTLLIAIPLAMSLSWTFGLASLVFGKLNLMTATLALVLFGLGIDYGIHFFARFAEDRESGLNTTGALIQTFENSGPPIAISALTTALSLLVLVSAAFKGFSQFGFIAAIGIVFAFVSMLTVLPCLVVLFERWSLLPTPSEKRQENGTQSGWKFPAPRLVLALTAVVLLASATLLGRVEFEYRFGELEPEFSAYNEVRRKVRRVYKASKKRNPAYIVVNDGAEIDAVTKTLEAIMVADTVTATIGSIESLQDRYSDDPIRQKARLKRLEIIRTLLADPFLEASQREELDQLREAAQTREHIPLDAVPDHLKSRFVSKSGAYGRFVIVYPSVGLSDGRQSMAFADDVGTITTSEGITYHAASTSLAGAEMLRLMLDESPRMVLVTFFVLIALMLLVFRSAKWASLALVPVLVGILVMLGIMAAAGIRLNFYNLVVLPAVLGIGNDCGIHIVHRYMQEGAGSLRIVLRSTGEHIAIGIITTMVGFGWWMFSHHPGLNSIGLVAVIGLGSILVSALVFLPALLQWLETRRHDRGVTS